MRCSGRKENFGVDFSAICCRLLLSLICLVVNKDRSGRSVQRNSRGGCKVSLAVTQLVNIGDRSNLPTRVSYSLCAPFYF